MTDPPKKLYKRKGSGRTGDLQDDEPRQLYRPVDVSDAETLLKRADLTQQDIEDFLAGKPAKLDPPKDPIMEAFHHRRRELSELSKKLSTGEARLDEYGRIVPLNPAPPRANLPPPPPLNQDNNQGEVLDLQNINLDEEDFLDQELQEAADAIARGVERYQIQEVPDEELLVILIEPQSSTVAPSLTFRRVCFAVLAVVTSFVCVILQTLPLFRYPEVLDPHFDKLMYELLHVRHLQKHAKECTGLQRDERSHSQGLLSWWMKSGAEPTCEEGVLHIPAKSVLSALHYQAAPDDKPVLEPYSSGINASWFLSCFGPDGVSGSEFPCGSMQQCETEARAPEKNCFRGVHDNIISTSEIATALKIGHELILNGSDHFDVQSDIQRLEREASSVLRKLENLLEERYGVDGIKPVAFRVLTAGPMDGHDVNLYRQPASALNHTSYLGWIEKSKSQNEMAYYSLPWPFRIAPKRDTCKLIADLESDSRFKIHTSVFLSDGAGKRYRGGLELFMDNHRSNVNPKHRVKRGVTVDGSRGRVMVSTGGIENRRCRLPTRAGLRAVLEIWWDCEASEHQS